MSETTETLYDEDQLYNEVYDTEEGEPTDEFLETLQALVETGYLRSKLYEDRLLYFAREGLKWAEFAHLDNRLMQKILLIFAKNPKTFFVLYNTQKGKMRIAALEIKAWAQERDVKPVAFVIVDNDKTLADQSEDGLRNLVGDNGELFLLSSNSSVKYEDIKTKIDAYAADTEGDYKMPVIVALANDKQTTKVMKLMAHIEHKATRGSRLRYGIVFDEADKIYPQLREKSYDGVTLRQLLVEEERALYKLGFVTATHGDLLDVEAFPECANAHLYETDSGNANYRALHHHDSVVKIVKHPASMENNTYASEIIKSNNTYFMTPVNGYYRKIIVNSNASAAKMREFADGCVERGMYAITFNMNGINVYGQGTAKKYSAKGRKFNEVLFYIYKTLKLHDKPLVIIGRRKVDRGLGFHYAPRTHDEITIAGCDGDLVTRDGEGLIWTDIILGRIDDSATAVQKAGRGAGIIAQCPQYIGSVTYWTDERTANTIKRHNQIVDMANTMGTCSAVQAVGHAEEQIPVIPERRPYELSPTSFASVKEAKEWALANTPRTYINKKGETVEYEKPSAYGLYAEDGTKGTTHIKYRGDLRAILTEEEVRGSGDLGYGVATSARVMPVYADIGQGANTAPRIMPVYSDVALGSWAKPRIMPILSGEPAAIRYIVIYHREE